MDQDSVNSSGPVVVMCRSGCGFYGNPATDSLCSKCFKDSLKKTNDRSVAGSRVSPVSTSMNVVSAPSLPSALLPTSDPCTTPSTSKPSKAPSPEPVADLKPDSEEPEPEEDKPPPKKKTTRCFSCNKKVGLTGFECRCGSMFCGQHRYSDMHDCPYDYRTAGKEDIRKALPQCAAPKVEKL